MSDAARARIITVAAAVVPVKVGAAPRAFTDRPRQVEPQAMVGRSRVLGLGPQTQRHMPMTYAAGVRLWEASTVLTVRYDAPQGIDDEALERLIQEDARELVRALSLPSNFSGVLSHLVVGREPTRVVDIRGGAARVARELQIPIRYQFFA
jgi:hypothetical protein